MSFIIQLRDDETGEWESVDEIPYRTGVDKQTFSLTKAAAKVEAVRKAKKLFFDGLEDTRVRNGNVTIWKDGRWIDNDETINYGPPGFEGFDTGAG